MTKDKYTKEKITKEYKKNISKKSEEKCTKVFIKYQGKNIEVEAAGNFTSWFLYTDIVKKKF